MVIAHAIKTKAKGFLLGFPETVATSSAQKDTLLQMAMQYWFGVALT